MSKNLQAKLLRVLQDRTFYKVGSSQPHTVDIRIIAATNQDLEEAIRTKAFREDLYYRLNVIRVDLPPLRERADDVPLLARYFMNTFGKKMGKDIRRISNDAMETLMNYSWPGNIRELQNAIERAVVVAETDEIRKEYLPSEVASVSSNHNEDWTLARMEKEHIMTVLNLVGGNKKKAATLLGLDATTLWRKLRK
jgi:transcriptional regulator with PAS, ATPase and Fis domain